MAGSNHVVVVETSPRLRDNRDACMRGCLDWQERTRKEVALAWDKVPAPVQETCAAASKPSGDYWRLKTCIDRQGKPQEH